jgi:hypothetical protein
VKAGVITCMKITVLCTLYSNFKSVCNAFIILPFTAVKFVLLTALLSKLSIIEHILTEIALHHVMMFHNRP